MTPTNRYKPAFSPRATSLALVVLMLPITSRGFAQTTDTQSNQTGVSLIESNNAITDLKPSQPIQPITTTTVVSNDTADKILADYATFEIQAKQVDLKFADPKNPTGAELEEYFKIVQSIGAKDKEFIDRINVFLADDPIQGSKIDGSRLETLQQYLKVIKKDKEDCDVTIAKSSEILNHSDTNSTEPQTKNAPHGFAQAITDVLNQTVVLEHKDNGNKSWANSLQQTVSDLRDIDISGCPQEFRLAFVEYIQVFEEKIAYNAKYSGIIGGVIGCWECAKTGHDVSAERGEE